MTSLANFPRGTVAFLVTSNIHKFNEARHILGTFRIATAMLKRIDPVEIQDDNIENVAKVSAIDAAQKCNLPVVVEDAGLSVRALDGFPGPYSSYIFKTIGNDGILKLMENTTERDAHFQSVVAFMESTMRYPLCFIGEAEGEVTHKKRGTHGFGFDSIFSPLDSPKTFAEMTIEEKTQNSHRASAFAKFALWYKTNL